MVGFATFIFLILATAFIAVPAGPIGFLVMQRAAKGKPFVKLALWPALGSIIPHIIWAVFALWGMSQLTDVQDAYFKIVGGLIAFGLGASMFIIDTDKLTDEKTIGMAFKFGLFFWGFFVSAANPKIGVLYALLFAMVDLSIISTSVAVAIGVISVWYLLGSLGLLLKRFKASHLLQVIHQALALGVCLLGSFSIFQGLNFFI